MAGTSTHREGYPDILKLKKFLRDLITPETELEKIGFREVVDDYIVLESKIDSMSREDLISEINNQLSPYNLSIDV